MTKQLGKAYLLRGAFGGTIGAVIGQLVLPKFHYGKGTEWFYFLLSLLFTIPIAGLVGALIGAIVWKGQSWTERGIGPVSSALIGGCLVGIASACLSYARYDDIQRSIVGFSYVRNAAILGALVGIGAGLMAGIRHRTRPE